MPRRCRCRRRRPRNSSSRRAGCRRTSGRGRRPAGRPGRPLPPAAAPATAARACRRRTRRACGRAARSRACEPSGRKARPQGFWRPRATVTGRRASSATARSGAASEAARRRRRRKEKAGRGRWCIVVRVAERKSVPDTRQFSTAAKRDAAGMKRPHQGPCADPALPVRRMSPLGGQRRRRVGANISSPGPRRPSGCAPAPGTRPATAGTPAARDRAPAPRGRTRWRRAACRHGARAAAGAARRPGAGR